MGHTARLLSISIPWLSTLASLIALLIELSGWTGGNHGSLNAYYFLQADFRHLSLPDAASRGNSTPLAAALELAQRNGTLADVYQVHLYDYCSSNRSNGRIDYCSARTGGYVFDFIDAWGLNATNATGPGGSGPGNAELASALGELQGTTEEKERALWGNAGREAMAGYRKVAGSMSWCYRISLYTTVATLAAGLLALFSRLGSFFTWLLALVSALLTFVAVLASTALFASLAAALDAVLRTVHVRVSLGLHALVAGWLAVAFSLFATSFWLVSICCCARPSNPHHLSTSTKGGLWPARADPAAAGHGGQRSAWFGRGRKGMQVQKTGGGYERVGSPVWDARGPGDDVPLAQYPGPSGGYGHQRWGSYAQAGPYEPMRH